MKNELLIFFLMFVFFIFLFSTQSSGQQTEDLQKSIELVGDKVARLHGLEGQGIKIGVIDTGIDYEHSYLAGYGSSGKVVGGFNYVSPANPPSDANGHGTEVSGIIAADKGFGIAPKSKLFSYKVSSTGEGVSSEYITDAIKRAVNDDGVNVINISLGINKTNDEIDNAIDYAVKKGVVVVVAAGNSGPQLGTIGSPGKDINAITVGASYNNLTSSLVATFEVGKKQYQVLPMAGTKAPPTIIEGKIVFGSYGRQKDLEGLDVRDSILLEERGSDIKNQKVYFAEKEKNAADMGAKALVIFNNQSGIFFGELVSPNKTSNYSPRIPVISMSRDDGLALKIMVAEKGRMNLFYHPDFVAPFSSRGPVSPFYIKPDLVAPGVFVNSTSVDGKFNLTSGTSVATPHVTGAAAILLQKHPSLDPQAIASLLVTTTDPVTDPYGKILPIEAVGSGRLNITRAIESNLIFSPHSLVYDLSLENANQSKAIKIKNIDGLPIPHLTVSLLANNTVFGFQYSQSNDTLDLKISYKTGPEGDYDTFIKINDTKTVYRIPVIIHVTKGSIFLNEKDGVISFSVNYPDSWTYAKISVMKDGTDIERSTAVTPEMTSSLAVYDDGEYWILAQIKNGNQTSEAYQTILVTDAHNHMISPEDILGIPGREVVIISGILVIITIVGLATRKH